MRKPSQGERILRVLLDAEGQWVSAKVFKRDMWISECNARISELRNKGYDIETGDFDEFGFALHRIKVKDPIQTTLLSTVKVDN